MRELPLITADWLLARVRDNGEGCLAWTGYSQKGNPKANFGGDNVPVNVRRAIWKALTGMKPAKGKLIRACCGTENCCEPAHLVQLPLGAKNKGRKQTIAEIARHAAALRAKSKIPQAEVPGIIDSELPREVLAQKWDVSPSMIGLIQTGKNRVDYSSPFVGLGAR